MLDLHLSGSGFEPFTLGLDRFEDNVRNARPAFEAMADLAAEKNRKQFQTQGTHSGTRWANLSPAYAAWKARRYPGKPILVRTGALRESLIRRPMDVDIVTDRGMTVGTSIPYAKWHQRGTPNMPARPLLGPPTDSEERLFAKILQEWIVRGSVSH